MEVKEDGRQKGIQLLSESISLLIWIRLQIGQENHYSNKY